MTITKKIAGLTVFATLSIGIQAFAATGAVMSGASSTLTPSVTKEHKTQTASTTKKFHVTTKYKTHKITTASSTKPVQPTTKKITETVKHISTKSTGTSKPSTIPSNSTNEGPVTAICNDGTESHAVNHSGACSDHGGVKTFTQQ